MGLCFRAVPAVIASLSSVAIAQTTWYVDDDAPGGDGSSWAEALTHLQDALDAAGPDDVIVVGQGEYAPDESVAAPDGTGNRSASFVVGDLQVLLGGFAGVGAGDPDERDPAAFATTLTGDLAGNDGPDFANRTDNARHVLTASGAAMIDGFVISRGYADGGDTDEVGAGALILEGEAMFIDCLFTENGASIGAGAYCEESEPAFIDCRFEGNSAMLGGGGNVNGGGIAAIMASPWIEGCVFMNNFANDRGGGVSGEFGADATIRSCVFQANEANHGGAMYADASSDPLINNTVFAFNNGNLTGGAARVSNGSFARFGNCVFYGNESNFGSAVFSQFNDTAPPQVANSILWANEDPQLFSPSAPIEVLYSCVEGGAEGLGVIESDPMLVDPDGLDFTLLAGSPCIDAGTNTKVPEALVMDLYGGDRLVDDPDTEDTGIGPGPVVDMGVYEVQAGCYADYNGDGVLSVLDFVAFQQGWVAQDDAADCNGDASFSILDFVCFQLAFEAGCP